MDHPENRDILNFLEAAKVGNFSRAAVRLGMTQPSLTRSIHKLEAALGVSLFIRSKAGVRLTRAGNQLLPLTKELAENLDKIRRTLTQEDEELMGSFLIGCHSSVAIYSVNHFFPKVAAHFKRVEFQFVHDLSRKIVDNVIAGQIDFGIVINPVKHPDLVIKEIARDEIGFWRAEKTELDTLIYDPELSQAQWLLAKIEKKMRFKRFIKSSNLEVIAEIVAQGCGVGILPARVARARGNGELRLQSNDFPRFIDHLCGVYRADSKNPISMEISQLLLRSKI